MGEAKEKAQSQKHLRSVKRMSLDQLRKVVKDGSLLAAAATFEIKLRGAKVEAA